MCFSFVFLAVLYHTLPFSALSVQMVTSGLTPLLKTTHSAPPPPLTDPQRLFDRCFLRGCLHYPALIQLIEHRKPAL